MSIKIFLYHLAKTGKCNLMSLHHHLHDLILAIQPPPVYQCHPRVAENFVGILRCYTLYLATPRQCSRTCAAVSFTSMHLCAVMAAVSVLSSSLVGLTRYRIG